MTKISISKKCTGCKACIEICPMNVYIIKNKKALPVNVKDCIECKICEVTCPVGAIKIG